MKHYVYIALIFSLMAFGKWYTDQAHTAGYNQAKSEYESALRKELNDQVANNQLLQLANDQLVLDLLNKQPEIKTVYETIEKKVNVYVKDNVACNLTRGGVWMRNQAGDPQQLQPGYHPALSESDSTRTSTITQRRAEEQIHRWGELYIDLSGKYKTLLSICESNKNKAVE